MTKLDVLGNIDAVNYIIQDVVRNIMIRPIEPRNNFYKVEGLYSCNITRVTKSQYTVNVMSNRQELCRIIILKDEMIVRYNYKFLFTYKLKTNLFSTPLFEEPFRLDELEARYFTENCVGFKYDVQVQFDFQIMIDTLSLCKDMYDAFLFHVKQQNAVDNN